LAREALLRAARAAIRDGLNGRHPMPALDGAPAELLERRGVFVTLRVRADGALRGCVGQAEPREPVLVAVGHAAVAAATRDPRFAPVTLGELPSLIVHVSVLGPLQPVQPGQVEVGLHGLLITHRGRQGLLLPHVADGEGWDRERLLRSVCRKAELSLDAWRDPACRLQAFTAVSFADELPGAAERPA
jgi:AmmeMemoRadiSam system protein A